MTRETYASVPPLANLNTHLSSRKRSGQARTGYRQGTRPRPETDVGSPDFSGFPLKLHFPKPRICPRQRLEALPISPEVPADTQSCRLLECPSPRAASAPDGVSDGPGAEAPVRASQGLERGRGFGADEWNHRRRSPMTR